MEKLFIIGLLATLGVGPLVVLLFIRTRVSHVVYLKSVIAASLSVSLATFGTLLFAWRAQPTQPLWPGILLAIYFAVHGTMTVVATLRDLRKVNAKAEQ